MNINKYYAQQRLYPMWVSEVCKRQFPQARCVSGDTDAATQTPTGHSRDRWAQE